MKRIITLLVLTFLFVGCEKNINKGQIQGKIENEQISVVSKIPGKIIKIFVKEGDWVKKGDTLALLDIPEVNAKINQAEGAVTSAKAQYNMAVKGATDNQIKQLEAEELGV